MNKNRWENFLTKSWSPKFQTVRGRGLGGESSTHWSSISEFVILRGERVGILTVSSRQ